MIRDLQAGVVARSYKYCFIRIILIQLSIYSIIDNIIHSYMNSAISCSQISVP